MEELLCFVSCLTGQVDAQLLEYIFIHRGQNYRRMYLAAFQLFQLLERQCRLWLIPRTNTQRNQYLIRMQARISVAQMSNLQLLNRFDNCRCNELHFLCNSC